MGVISDNLIEETYPCAAHLLSRKEFSVERGKLEEDADGRAELRQRLLVQRADLPATI